MGENTVESIESIQGNLGEKASCYLITEILNFVK